MYSVAALTRDGPGPRPRHRELTRAELVAMDVPAGQALTTGHAPDSQALVLSLIFIVIFVRFQTNSWSCLTSFDHKKKGQ